MVSVVALVAASLLIAAAPAAALEISPDPGLLREPLTPLLYEVVPGDTLLGLAQKFEITPDTIRWANGLGEGDLLKIGQKLTILPVSGVLHRVKAGESVLSIAADYGANPAEIVEANLISDPALVREGDLLIVPGGVMKSSPAAPAPSAEEEPLQYTVKPGDTLSSIAANFGVRISALRSANGLGDSDLLRIGQLLSIPGGKQPAEAAPAPAEEPPAEPQEAPSQEREASNRGDQGKGKSFIATLTAYSIQGRTATGSATRWGVVAVDPRVIPLGSRLRIDGFEETFVAEDTGGGIRGNWVDVWFQDFGEAMRFGMQSRRVTIVE
ncbi:MAG: LysM peptidoglycan-binding domain-containing protein [Chloroflexota bacterium]